MNELKIIKLFKEAPRPLYWITLIYVLTALVSAMFLAILQVERLIIIIAIFVYIGLLCVLLLTWIIYGLFYIVSNKKQTANGMVALAIVVQDDEKRDEQFNEINESVKETYWVLGSSLTSVAENENQLSRKCERQIKVKLCMLDPDITINEELCSYIVEHSSCHVQNLISTGKIQDLSAEDILNIISQCSCDKDILRTNPLLINDEHLQDYYGAHASFKLRVSNSYAVLKQMQSKFQRVYGEDSFCLLLSKSFVPITLTIADAHKDEGKLIAEFHMPFTNTKILIKLNKKENEELFNKFVDFYNAVCNRAVVAEA